MAIDISAGDANRVLLIMLNNDYVLTVKPVAADQNSGHRSYVSSGINISQ